MICNTYLLIPVCLALTAATPIEDNNRALSEASETEITPSRPPEDLIPEDDAEEAPDAEETPRTTGRSFMATARQKNFTFSRNTAVEEDKHYNLRIVEENGVRYYDVSEEVDLVLEANGQNVTGITAAGPECRLVTLELLAGYVLSEGLRDKCKNLRNVTLAGSNWKCVGTLPDFVEALGDRVSYKDALCGDVKCTGYLEHRSCSLKTGMNLTKMHNIKENECPAVCTCSLKLWKGEFWYPVNCVNANITDETLPSFPPASTSLVLSKNQLRSTSRLFEKLKDLKNLLILYLGENQLDSLPYFQAGSFANLKQIFLHNNTIRRFDAGAIKSMMGAKNENFRIGLFGNPVECGEEIKQINILQMESYFVVSDWMKIKCTEGGKEYFVKFYKAAPQEVVPSKFDPLSLGISFLGAMNVFLVYVIYDLWMAKREMRKTMEARRPLLDKILCGLSVCCRTLFSRSFWRPEEESKGSTDAFYKSPDQVAIRKRTPKAARANASETDVP